MQMNVITIEEEAFKLLVAKIENLEKRFEQIVNKASCPTKERWLDIQDVLQILKCSRRHLQNYRNEGKLPFSQIGQKIYFKSSDVEHFLEKNYKNVRRF